MKLFLTSSPTGPLDNSYDVNGLDDKNRFVDNLRRRWKPDSRVLYVSAFPADTEFNDIICGDMARIFTMRSLSVSAMDVWDSRTVDFSPALLHSYDVVILGGGHVPTQNAFLHKAGLREGLRRFEGIVIGISAGTMNAAEEVYAQPEEAGESLDPEFRRFIPGLGLTRLNILPHYQAVKDSHLDGKRLFEDITYGDSTGRSFLALPDGSYVLGENGHETLYGEAWRIADGRLEQICRDGQTLALR
jgi:dipeptidase E